MTRKKTPVDSIKVSVDKDGRIREHVVHLWRRPDGSWYWERKGGNRSTIAVAHRTWSRRSAAENNLGIVNAQPYRLVVHE